MNSSHLPGKFVWFEHASADPRRARAFYEPLFGWHFESVPMGAASYSMIVGPAGEGIGGLIAASDTGPARWTSYLSVADVDAACATALAAGARSRAAPADVAGHGRGALIVDPTGAEVWLWRSDRGDRPDPAETPVGGWFWNELETPDAKTALAFYERVAGYTHEAMDMGPHGTYYLLKGAGGVARAGVMQTTMSPPLWLPYVRVADCDASAAQAGTLGAQVVVAPTDIPGVGRFAVLIDPQGAGVAVMKGQPARE